MNKMNIFNTVKMQKQKFNTFDLTHDVKFSAKMGELTPVLCTEVVPGDRFNIGADTLIRFAPLIAPVMHRFDSTIHYFFVPNRILWNDFEDFMTQNATVTAPYFQLGPLGVTPTDEQARFLDFMGIPDAADLELKINALPIAAYQAVYNEYYRDQNLISEVPYKLSSGQVTLNITELLKLRLRAWTHDYFTAALPFAQKGSSATIPLGDVTLKGDRTGMNPVFYDASNNAIEGLPLTTDPDDGFVYGDGGTQVPHAYDPDGTLEVSPTTINNLRIAFRLQEWLEKQARGGTRYIESILSHFGVRSSDKRLQRPEYITGVKNPIVISEVLNTTGEEGGLPQGNMAGHAVGIGSGFNGSYFAEEHGFIIGIMSVMPRPAYMQGLPKQFSKFDALDYYWPSFAHLGEQQVLNKEIFAKSGNPEDTFGYIPRYSEYKYIPSRVAGQFRETLDYWHLARKFDTQPTLSQEFIECDPADLTRIFAVETDDDNLFCHVLHKISARRPMPIFGTPTI